MIEHSFISLKKARWKYPFADLDHYTGVVIESQGALGLIEHDIFGKPYVVYIPKNPLIRDDDVVEILRVNCGIKEKGSERVDGV